MRSRAGQNLARLYEDLADAERRLAELEESAAARGGALHTERFMEKQKRANVIRMEIAELRIAIDWAQVTANASPTFDTQVTR